MLTAAGSGYSRWRDIAVTRWREDVTRDEAGMHVYLRDVQSGQSWSVGYQPTGVEPESYEVVFSEDRAKIARRDGAIATTLDVIVSPEDDAEIRRRVADELRSAGAGDRADLLRRGGAGPTRGRRRASGVFQPLRPHGVRTRV